MARSITESYTQTLAGSASESPTATLSSNTVARKTAANDLTSRKATLLRVALSLIVCLAFTLALYRFSWLLPVVTGILLGLGILYLIVPLSHQHKEISDSYD